MFQDLSFGVRMLRKNPGFTAVAVLSLALGIGANTAIFQLVNAVRLKTLPVPNADQLVNVQLNNMDAARGNKPSPYASVTNPIWEQIRDRQQGFSGILAWSRNDFNLAQGGEVRWAKGLWVSGDFFNVLGVRPERGRLLTTADDQRGCSAPGAVISHSFWQREYGGDPNVIGRKVTLSDRPFEIIGVTPANFFGLEVGRTFDVALPLCADALIAGKNTRLDSGFNWWLMVTGRLKPGWTIEQATAQLQSISPDLFKQTLPPNYPPVSVNPYLESKLEAVENGGAGYSTLRASYEGPLWLLLAIAGLVLLIACANLANLLLARASRREREIAVRQAVGASRARIIRQLLVETVLLTLLGTSLAALLAQGMSRFLVSLIGTGANAVFLDLTPDWRVLGFTAGVAAITCLLFGLTPAFRATSIELSAVMKATGRGLSGARGFTLRRALVVVQVSLSLVLVASAFLFTRSLNKLLTLDAGFNQENLLVARVGFRRLNIAPERRIEFKNQLLERLKVVPGVQSVAEADAVPLTGGGRGNVVWAEGTPDNKIDVSFNRVSSDYFQTIQLPLRSGRGFNSYDNLSAPKVAIVNETFARQLLQEADPVGRRVVVETTPTEPETTYEIVGIARDAKFEELKEKSLAVMYLPALQDPQPAASRQFLIRSNLPQAEIIASVNRALTEVSPSLDMIYEWFRTMVQGSMLRERLMATLSGFFGALALVLATIGLYGILSYGVASRTNEIGIRIALGANTREVVALILREALLLVAIGIVAGIPAVFVVARFAGSLLFDIAPTDPVSLMLAGLVMLAIAIVAAFLPARRATKIDPLVALRYE